MHIPENKKTVSYSQFSNWWSCPHRYYRDYILHEKTFEDNLILSFGTAVHETIQLYLKTLYGKLDADAERINMIKYFTWAFKKQIKLKKIPHTDAELNEFLEDGQNILNEFKEPSNRLRYFPRDKWELLSIEEELNEDIRNNITLNGYIDIVLREKLSGNIRIIDIKTSNSGWNSYQQEDWVKNAQLILYKTLYSKKHNIPLSKIYIEFFILRRKLYKNCSYEQSRIQIFKPSAYQKDIIEVIHEFGKFIDTCFTSNGIYNTSTKYPKIPNGGKNCKYCNYKKNGSCDGKADIIEEK